MDLYAHYVESLYGSWKALTTPHRAARVTRTDGFVACQHPNPVLNNALVLQPDAAEPARDTFTDAAPFALWCRDDDVETTLVLEHLGFQRDVTSCAMRCDLEGIAASEIATGVLVDVDVARVAELNGLPHDLLVDVPGARGYATAGFEAALLTITLGSDANISFVTTRHDARYRGHATTLTAATLHHCRQLGALTATLQASPMAEQLYAKVGFERIARLQEWLPPTHVSPE